MRVKQYAYFALTSDEITAAEIGIRVGLEPDEVVVRGLRTQDPPVPVVHRWKIVCRTANTTVEQQIGEILDRVGPFAGRVRDLVESTDVEASLQMVRYFDDDEGQDHVLGWHLDRSHIDLLHTMHAEIDSDEY